MQWACAQACVVLVQAVLEPSTSEAAWGRTGSVGQSGCEGEDRGAVQKVHSVPVQVALSGRAILAEVSKHANGYKPHQPGQCTGTCCRTLAHTALACCQLSGRQRRVPEQASGGGSRRAEPLTQTWSIPQSPQPGLFNALLRKTQGRRPMVQCPNTKGGLA